jgi:hypothetical protein
MSLCKHCGKPLNQSQYRRRDRTYKSCPRCSVEDGEEHIYYEYPSCFGTTPLRSTESTPDGAQSYCQLCRGGKRCPHQNHFRCSQL